MKSVSVFFWPQAEAPQSRVWSWREESCAVITWRLSDIITTCPAGSPDLLLSIGLRGRMVKEMHKLKVKTAALQRSPQGSSSILSQRRTVSNLGEAHMFRICEVEATSCSNIRGNVISQLTPPQGLLRSQPVTQPYVSTFQNGHSHGNNAYIWYQLVTFWVVSAVIVESIWMNYFTLLWFFGGNGTCVKLYPRIVK